MSTTYTKILRVQWSRGCWESPPKEKNKTKIIVMSYNSHYKDERIHNPCWVLEYHNPHSVTIWPIYLWWNILAVQGGWTKHEGLWSRVRFWCKQLWCLGHTNQQAYSVGGASDRKSHNTGFWQVLGENHNAGPGDSGPALDKATSRGEWYGGKWEQEYSQLHPTHNKEWISRENMYREIFSL